MRSLAQFISKEFYLNHSFITDQSIAHIALSSSSSLPLLSRMINEVINTL